jgi:stearoyl-CoA desaturase (delta-9 desaturase)
MLLKFSVYREALLSSVAYFPRYYALLMPLLAFIIPTYLPVYLWHEDPWVSWNVTIFRWMYALHCVWLINSAAHRWGSKPYEK